MNLIWIKTVYEEVNLFTEFVIPLLEAFQKGLLVWTARTSSEQQTKVWFEYLKLNDMVLIKEKDLLPRNQWRRGVLHELVFGCDNQTRGVVLRVMSNGKFNYIKRDVKPLILFELENENDVDDDVYAYEEM